MNDVKYATQSIRQAFTQSSANLLYGGIQKNPEAFDTIGPKMVRGEQTDAAIQDKELIQNPQHDVFLKNAVSRSIERINDNANILQMLPDTKQSIEIIIGTVLSPKDMMQPTLTFRNTNKVFGDAAGSMIKMIENYFTSSYKIQDKLSDMLWDILGKTGSYPIAVLPETSVDHMINSNTRVTMEDVTGSLFSNDGKLQNLGYLGGSGKQDDQVSTEDLSFIDFMKSVSLENYAETSAKRQINDVLLDSCLNIKVLDNFDALKLPLLKNKISRQASHDIVQLRRETVQDKRFIGHRIASSEAMRVDTRDYTQGSETEKQLNKFYPDRQFKSTPVMRVRSRMNLEKETVGHPLCLKIPTEATVPVYNPMDPRDHIGYFIMIDQTGNAVRLTDLDNMYKMLQTSSNVASNSSVMSYLLQQSANASNPASFDINRLTMMEGFGRAAPIFQEMVERDLLERLSRGTFGTGLSLGRIETASMIMLSRAIAGKHTQLLFIPADLMSYLAIDFDEYGLGKTLLDDSKLIAALRSMNMVVNSIASSKNAITKRILNAELDPAEKNPQKAMQMIMHEYVKGTQAEYPLTNNPVDQINFLQMAGVQVNIADHPRLPSSKLGVDYIDNQYKPIDTTFDEWLKKLHAQAIGVSPELIEGAGSTDFATQTVLANVLTARRIDMISRKFTASLTGFIRTYTYNSQILFDELKALVKTNHIRLKKADGTILTDDEVVVLFIEAIEVSLPAPDTTQQKEQKEAFEAQAEFYETAITYFFDPEFLTESDLGRLGSMENIGKLQKYIKSHFMRQWMQENGVMTELFDMITTDAKGRPLIDFLEQKDKHMEALMSSLMPLMKKEMKRSGDINAALDKYEEGLANPPAEDGDGGGGYDGGYDSSQSTDETQSFDDEGFNEFEDTSSETTESTSETEGDPESQDEETPQDDEGIDDAQQ